MSSLPRMAVKALQMIKKNGAAMTLTRAGAPTVDAAGKVTSTIGDESATVGVFLPLTSYSDNREEVASLAQRNVRYLLLAGRGMTLDPQAQDVIASGDKKWRVESSTPINPQDKAGGAIVHQSLVVQL